ncbi:MAG: helix-turn-helix transcriptional regulator [Candidatus Hodarchaeales archaeon]|jgi:DNA-binding PadR family transcriptional regulator
MSDDLLLQKWQREYKKGYSKPLILFTLAEVEKSYPFPLTEKLKELTKGQISILGSNIYPLLSKLEEEELIEYQKDESDRKEYKLSEKGFEFVKTLGLAIEEFNENLLEIITKTLKQGGSE